MQDVGRVHVSPNLTETVDRITDAAVRQGGLRLYPKGTLLVPKSGASVNLNHRAMLGRAAYVVSHLATIVPDSRRVDPSYLFHWSMVYDPRKQAQVTSLPSLPLSLIKAALVPLPPLDEQRRIVGLLDRAAEIRRRADAARAKARAIIPALFLDMFGDPATILGRFDTQTFDDLVASKLIGLVRSTREQPEDGAVGYVRMNAITADGRVVLNDIRRTNVSNQERSSFELLQGDLLFNTRNSLDLVGKMGIYLGPPGNVYNNNILRVRFRADVSPYFVNHYFQSPQGRAHIAAVKKGTTSVAAVYYKDLAKIPVPVPELPVQAAFAEQAQRLEATARALDAAAAKAQALAAGLSAEVFGAGERKEAASADGPLAPC